MDSFANPVRLSSTSACGLVRGVCAGCFQPLLPPGLSRRYLYESVLRCLSPYPGGSSECICLVLPQSHRRFPHKGRVGFPLITSCGDSVNLCGHSVSRSEPRLCFLSSDTFACSPLPSRGYRGRSFRKPCGSPPSSVLRGRKTAPPSVCGRLRSPLVSALPLLRAEMGNPGAPFAVCGRPGCCLPPVSTASASRRPRWSGPGPHANPSDEVFLHWPPSLHKFRARTWRGRAELAEEHGHKLAPAAEAPGVSLGTVFAHRGFKFQTRDQLQNL
jgi:hypothetical protein